MPVTIRRAKKEDCPRLLELVHELAVYEKAPQEVTVTLKHFEESGFGEQPVWWAFVATSHQSAKWRGTPFSIYRRGWDEVRASLILYPLFHLERAKDVFGRYYRTEEARGKGIGKLLIDRLIEEAKEKKFSGMMWQVLEWNEPAINFYKKYNANFDAEWVNCSINFV